MTNKFVEYSVEGVQLLQFALRIGHVISDWCQLLAGQPFVQSYDSADMTDIRYYSKQFLREFIELYKSEPSLWKIQSPEYKDRRQKDKSYEKLVKKLREVDPNADRNSVLKKVNSFRTCFRKEYKKKLAFSRAGHTYKPNLWYFDILQFLVDNNNECNEDPSSSNSYREEISSDRFEYIKMENLGEDIMVDENTEVWEATPDDSNLDIQFMSKQDKEEENIEQRFPNRISQSQILYAPSIPSRPANASVITEDEYDYIGKNVAAKLRRLPSTMQIISEKLINDVLYQAQLNNLNVNSCLEINSKIINQTKDSSNK